MFRKFAPSLFLLIGCTPPEPAPPQALPGLPPSSEVRPDSKPSAKPADAAPPATAASSAAPAAPPPAPSPSKAAEHRWTVPLSGRRQCTLLVRSEVFNERDAFWAIGSIEHVATEAGGSCAGGTLFDMQTDKLFPDQTKPEALGGGLIAKPGRRKEVIEEVGGLEGGLLEDLNFDGQRDLCLTKMTGAYNYSQLCWLFDPATRRFVRHEGLEEIIFVKVDRRRKLLTHYVRQGGPHYLRQELRWRRGELVVVRKTEINTQEDPTGKALPEGRVYEVHYERQGDRLVKTFAGLR